MGVGLLWASGCSRGPERIHPPALDAAAAAAAAVQQYDTDGDGKIAGEELDEAPALKQALANLDTDGDQAVTAAEIEARIDSWRQSRMGLASVSCAITKGGKPLEGATLTFDPENFLGDGYVAATGETDEYGMVVPSIPTTGPTDPPGVPPGFYLVRITHPTLDIPAKYNSETTLGQEVALDARNLFDGLAYELD